MRFNTPTTIIPIPIVHLIRSGQTNTKIPTIIMTIPGNHVPIACYLLDNEFEVDHSILKCFLSITLAALVQTKNEAYLCSLISFFTDSLSLISWGNTAPPDITIFKALSTDISTWITSSSLTI